MFRSRNSMLFVICSVIFACEPPGEPVDGGASGDGGAITPPTPVPPEVFADAIVPSSPVNFALGQYAVSADGASTFTYPVAVPDGRRGMSPSLSIVYNSRSGNGMLGVGWALTGLSEISRCGMTPISDGVTDGVRFESTDRFCLDGDHLVMVPGSSAYGAAGSEYRTRTSGPTKVVLNTVPDGDDASFTAWTPGGTILHFGAIDGRNDALLRGPRWSVETSGGTTEGAMVTLRWLVSRIEDRAGNSIDFHYRTFMDDRDRDPQDGHETLIDRITFTGHPSLGEGNREIRFSYLEDPSTGDSRPDSSFSWISGLRVAQRHLLRSIEVRVPVEPYVSRRYELDYVLSGSTHRSLLRQLRECDAFGRCVATDFDYAGDEETPPDADTAIILDPLIDAPDHWYDELGIAQQTVFPGDYDGDGKSDLLLLDFIGVSSTWKYSLSSGDSLSAPRDARLPTVAFVGIRGFPFDLDGDGADEFLTPWTSWQAHSFDGSRFNLLADDLGLCPHLQQDLTLGDMDGSGVPDLVTACQDGTEIDWGIRFHSSGRYGAYGPVTPVPFAMPPAEARQVLADIDGDHRADLLVRRSGETEYQAVHSRSDGTITIDPAGLAMRPDDRAARELFVDVNGDGLADVVEIGGAEQLSLRFNTGRGFLARQSGLDPTSPILDDRYESRTANDVRLLDANNDGLTDLLVLFEATDDHPGRAILHESTGHSFIARSFGYPGTPNTLDVRTWGSTQILDINGDGTPDFTFVQDGRLKVHRSGQVMPDLLERVTSNGTADQIFYADVSDPTVYTAGGGCDGPTSFPQRCLRTGMHVVRRHVGAEGLKEVVDYHYVDGRFHVQGQGWLGFGVRRVSEPSGEYREIRTNHSTTLNLAGASGGYPFAHLPARIEHVVPIGMGRTKAFVSVLTYEARPLGVPGQYVVVLTHRVDSEYEMLGSFGGTLDPADRFRSASTTFDYDDYGNLDYVGESFDPAAGRRDVFIHTENRAASHLIGLVRGVSIYDTALDGSRREVRAATYDLDDRGFVEQSNLEPGRSDLFVVQRGVPDGLGLVHTTRLSDLEGHVREVTIDYDDDGIYPRRYTDSLGHQRVIVVHPAIGRPILVRQPWGEESTFQYDGFGRIVRESDDDGSWRVTLYQPPDSGDSLKLVRRYSSGAEEELSYDWLGQLHLVRARGLPGTWFRQPLAHDSDGRLVGVYVPSIERRVPVDHPAYSLAYDATNRLIGIRYPTGARDTIRYERDSSTTLRRSGLEQTAVTDARGRITRVVDSVGGATQRSARYDYGPFDVVDAVTDQHGKTWRFAHDPLGRLTGVTDVDTGLYSFAYYPMGELRHEGGPEGLDRAYFYDSVGRLTRIDSATDGTTERVWDPAGHPGLLHSATSGHRATTTFEYSPGLAQVTGETLTLPDGLVRRMERSYDRGQLRTVTYPSVSGSPSLRLRYEYGFGHLQRIRDAASGSLVWSAEQLDPSGVVTEESFGNRIQRQTLVDDRTGRIRRIYTTALSPPPRPSAVPIQDVSYEIDDDGELRVAEDRIHGRHEEFGYDASNRIVYWSESPGVSLRYAYDDADNLQLLRGIVQEFADPGRPHVITRSGGASVSSDGRGRVSHHASRYGITWSSFDLPREVDLDSVATTYSYDAFHRRVLASTPARAQRVVAIPGMFEERESPREHVTVDRIYAGTREIAQSFTDMTTGETRLVYLLEDYRGSVDAVASPDGEIEDDYRYMPFGRRVHEDGSPAPWSPTGVNVGFAGLGHDATGLIDMVGRVYDPDMGQFLSTDPLFGDIGDPRIGPYSYVNNRPTALTDPTGFYAPCDELSVCVNGFDPATGQPWGGSGLSQILYATRSNQIVGVGLIPTAAISDYQGHHWPGLSRTQTFLQIVRLWPFQTTHFEAVDPLREPARWERLRRERILGRCRANALETCTYRAMGIDTSAPPQYGFPPVIPSMGAAVQALPMLSATSASGVGPVAQGAAGVEQAITDLEAAGGRVLGREITIETGGVRARPDLFVELPNGQRAFLEIKTGPSARLTRNQSLVFPILRSQGGIPRGLRAFETGELIPGRPTGPIPVWEVYQSWPLP